MEDLTVGTLEVRVVRAEYDSAFLESPRPHTFCALWVLEKVKWRRRKSALRGHGKGESPLQPVWDESFTFEDVRSDSKVAIDVWNVPGGANAHEFFGKTTVSIAQALQAPVAAWNELLPGRVHIALYWTPQLESEDLGERVALTLPAHETPQQALPPSAPPRPTPAKEYPSEDVATGEAPAHSSAPSPSVNHSRALAGLEAQALAYENESESDSDARDSPIARPVAAPAPHPAASPAPARKAEYFEFTHRGGTGNGPKENQDAYFLAHIDDQNAVFGVLDGHGGDHGAVAAQAGAACCKQFLVQHFSRLAADPEGVMRECFEAAHNAVFLAIKTQGDGVFEDPDTPGVLVQEVEEDEWPLGFDAADGGTTCSLGALVNGRTLIYAAAGDSCSLLAVPQPATKTARTIELVPEHSPTNQGDWEARLCKTGVHVVFDHPEMFDDQPASLLPVFTRNAQGGWHIADATLAKADELGCGLKTERGDRAAVVMTPESGRFSQMMLGVTRSVGDFYHRTPSPPSQWTPPRARAGLACHRVRS